MVMFSCGKGSTISLAVLSPPPPFSTLVDRNLEPAAPAKRSLSPPVALCSDFSSHPPRLPFISISSLLGPFSPHLFLFHSLPRGCLSTRLLSLSFYFFNAFSSFSFLAFSPSTHLSFFSILARSHPTLSSSLYFPFFSSPLPPTNFNQKGERLVMRHRILRFQSLLSLSLSLIGPRLAAPWPGLC